MHRHLSALRLAAFVVFVFVVGVAGASAQSPTQAQPQLPKMDFDAVIKQAIAKNPTVAIAAKNIERSETLLRQARAITLPLVVASVTNTTLDAARGFAGGVTQPQNQFVLTGNATMPVLAASRWAAVNQARDQVEVATFSADEVKQNVVVAAAETYLQVIAAHRQADVSLRALESARAHLDYATRRFEGGAGSRLNQLRAAQVVSSEEARLEAVQLAVRNAQEALGVIIVADGPVDAASDPAFDMSGAMEDNAWRKARPDLITQAAIQRAAERVVKDSWRDWVPYADATFSPTLLSPSGLFQPSKTWRLALTVTMPIYEGGQRKILLDQREITFEQSNLQMSALELQAQSEVRRAQDAVRSLARALDAARRAADQTGEVLQITTSAFEVGATTNLEVIDAQRSDLDAKTAAAIAENALQRARLDLLVALGRFK